MNFVDTLSLLATRHGSKGETAFCFETGAIFYWKDFVSSAPTVDGVDVLATANGSETRWVSTSLNRPIGTIRESANRNAKYGELACDGSAVSRTTYANLFNYINETRGTVTITIATPGVVTLSSHGFSTADRIYLTTTGALPTGLTANTLYYVIAVDASTFRLATTRANARAGTAINTTGSQSGTHTLIASPFGNGDGSTTFNLPDGRGASFAGVGTSTSYTQNVTRIAGENLDDAMHGHWHNIGASDGSAGAEKMLGNSTYGTSRLNNQTLENGARTIVTDGTNGTPRTTNETRGKTLGVYYFIKY